MTTLTLNIEGSNSLTLSVGAGATQADLALKVDKVEGKGLSTNDLTDELKEDYDNAVTDSHTHSNKSDLDKVSGNNTGDQDLSALIDNSTDTYTSEAKIMHAISLTQVEYDAIETPDENTLYYIPAV